MAINPDFKDLLLALFDARARFLIVGAHAVMHYTAPRYTKDLDIWVDPTPENAPRVIAALEAFGAPLFDLEIEDLAKPGVTFQIGIEPNRIDILTEVELLDFEAALDRCATTSYGGVPIGLLSIDDLIKNKESVGRLQDQLDVENLRKVIRRLPPPS
jgi:hypothetical protein